MNIDNNNNPEPDWNKTTNNVMTVLMGTLVILALLIFVCGGYYLVRWALSFV